MLGTNSKIISFLNYKIRIITKDSRAFVGTFKAFDKHMNIILGDCEEYRKIRPSKRSKMLVDKSRTLGLVLIRGENIASILIEAPPADQSSYLRTSWNQPSFSGYMPQAGVHSRP